MRVIITPRAEADIAHQNSWGQVRFGSFTAERTFDRVAKFIDQQLTT